MHTGRGSMVVVALMALTIASPIQGDEPLVCEPIADVEVPAFADRDGTPFAARLVLTPCVATSFDEVRVWLGNETHQASRIWNATDWTAATRYVPLSALAGDRGGFIVALQANPKATHAEPLLGGEQTTLLAKFRGPARTTDPLPLGPVHWVETRSVGQWGESPWITVSGEHGELLASAPTGFDSEGDPLPAGFARVAVPADASVAIVPRDAGVRLVGVAPDAWKGGGDWIELEVVSGAGDLRGLRLEDGEGALIFPDAVASPGERVVVARADVAEAFREVTDARVFVWEGELQGVTTLHESGTFALAKDGDELRLVYGDSVVDAFVYGDGGASDGWTGKATEASSLSGRVYRRLGDTQTADDWARPRAEKLLQTDRATEWFEAQGPLRAFTCPEACWHEVAMRFADANTSIDINLYELGLQEAVEALVDAERRGVEVRLLLHPRAVGASDDEMARLAGDVALLLSSGVEVRIHNGMRYAVDHAKYFVVDGNWTVVLSENANARGWAPSTDGNRGWGIAVHDAPLAAWMTGMFENDHLHAIDSSPALPVDFSGDPMPLRTLPAPTAAAPRSATLVVEGPVRVMPVVAPDHFGDPATSPLVDALFQAQQEIWTQQLNLPLTWSRPGYSADSPLAVALVEAAARGVDVRGTLADAFEDGDVMTDGNDRTAAVLSARSDRIDLRLGDAPYDDGIVHNKGWLVDPVASGRNLVVIGSANGNLASQSQNREVDLFIEHEAIAAFYRDVLAADWEKARLPPAPPGSENQEPATALPAPAFAATLALLSLVLRRARRAS